MEDTVQVSAKLRRSTTGYAHWCPGCGEMHPLPDQWRFDGNLENPTFSPSFLHSSYKRAMRDGQWTGGWERDANDCLVRMVCHYILTAGVLNFCGDSTHALAGQAVPLPKLPKWATDDDYAT